MTKQSNHNADISNPNKGSNGTNPTYDRNQGNRGWQLNPQTPKSGGKKQARGTGELVPPYLDPYDTERAIQRRQAPF